MEFDCIVVGAGLIGSAAAKHLSACCKTMLIGAPEPANAADGIVFASHYDASRIQRVIGKDKTWTLLNHDSVAAYAALEQATRITFFHEIGCLYVTPYGEDEYLSQAKQTSATISSPQYFSSREHLKEGFPGYEFPRGSNGLLEQTNAGIINPRLLIEAQKTVFKNNGGESVDAVVNRISRFQNSWKVETLDGKTFFGSKVLIATGSFSNFFDLIPEKLIFSLKGETTIWIHLDPSEARRLSYLPALLYEIEDIEIQNIYLVPPIQYPDGNFYLKMGANMPEDVFFDSLEEVQQWFRDPENGTCLNKMLQEVLKIIPSLEANAAATKRCIVANTAHRKPYIGEIQTNLFLAAGGNGYSAMCSEGLGKLASCLIIDGTFSAGYSPADFTPVFK